jgi:hypothetical protein
MLTETHQEVLDAYTLGRQDEANKVYDNKPTNPVQIIAYNLGRVDCMLEEVTPNEKIIKTSYDSWRKSMITQQRAS